MNTIGFHKTTKYMMITLLSVMLISTAFGAINIAPAKAEWAFTLHATVTQNPYWGYYGGYHSIWQAIKADLAVIGINVEINQYSDFGWYDRVWDVGWDKSWEEGGWDMTILEWWLQPQAVEPWFVSMVHGDLTQDKGGYNLHPWTNDLADTYLEGFMSSFEANERKRFLDAWQVEFLKDMPWINLYYPKTYDIMGAWITGYDPTATWLYDVTHLTLDNDLRNAAIDRADNTVVYAVSEALWALSPLFMDTYTDEMVSTLCFRTLYRWTVDPFPMDGSLPNIEDYTIMPELADGYPDFQTGANGPNTRVEVNLRSGLLWSDNQPLNATDVKYSFDTMLDLTTKCTGTGDFMYTIDSVDIINETAVAFNLKQPHADFLSILADDWGGSIIPYHFLKDIPNGQLRHDDSNWGFDNPAGWMPCNGPFMLDPANPPQPDMEVQLIKNDNYYSYGIGGGPYNVDRFIVTWIKDAASRIIAYQDYSIDFGEYPTADTSVFEGITDPYLNVLQYWYPASNPIWINFDNEYLSNRYVRLAIANAINYLSIIDSKLGPWGIAEAQQGVTYVLPQHYYTEPDDPLDPDLTGEKVLLFNSTLDIPTYDPVKAQQYMDLYLNSTTAAVATWTKGPVGDAEFDTDVDIDDFYIWRDEDWLNPFPTPFLPAHDTDSDFDNNGIYHYNDFTAWRDIGWPKGSYP